MKTIVIDENGMCQLDDKIVGTLKLKHVTSDVLDKAHMRIGVRNEYGKIYREIGVNRLMDFLKAVDVFCHFGFVEEFGHEYIPRGRYDAIFTPGSVH
ncbi:MAG TPA: hypothetical protein VIF82_13020 [Burkholderiaceae bacterium]|jgi:hypothetical protein